MRKLSFLLASLFLFACSQRDQQPVIRKKGLDLEQVDFKEKPLEILKSKIDTAANNDEEILNKGYSAPFDYPEGYKLNAWNGRDSFYGKAYYSEVIDSIAYFQNIYFNRIAFLTHNDKTVAILANAEINSDTVYHDFVKQLTKKFGKPSFTPPTTIHVFYEWSTKDRYIQIDYSTGVSLTAMSGKDQEIKQTFNMEMLIFNKEAANSLEVKYQQNYAKTKNYKVMHGDFSLYKHDPQKNIVLGDSLLQEKFK